MTLVRNMIGIWAALLRDCARILSSTLLFLTPLGNASGQALGDDVSCSYISSQIEKIESIDMKAVGIDRQSVECLINELQASDLKNFVTKTGFGENHDDDSAKYGMITGALVGVLNDENVDGVGLIRGVDDVDVASVLAFGAGHYDKNVRLNSSRILASIVDNTTLCVVIDHLNTAVTESSSDNPSIHRRANLLAVASVVAPWAHAENYEALLKTKIAIEGQIESLGLAEKANLNKTNSLLVRLEQRLMLQKSATDREISAPKDFSANNLLDGCKSYEFQNPEAEVLYSFGN